MEWKPRSEGESVAMPFGQCDDTCLDGGEHCQRFIVDSDPPTLLGVFHSKVKYVLDSSDGSSVEIGLNEGMTFRIDEGGILRPESGPKPFGVTG